VEVVFGGSVRHFQQYFSYIVAVSLFLVDETGVGRDRMVVGFTTTYAISAYNH
jgi:hypothetical protein